MPELKASSIIDSTVQTTFNILKIKADTGCQKIENLNISKFDNIYTSIYFLPYKVDQFKNP